MSDQQGMEKVAGRLQAFEVTMCDQLLQAWELRHTQVTTYSIMHDAGVAGGGGGVWKITWVGMDRLLCCLAS